MSGTEAEGKARLELGDRCERMAREALPCIEKSYYVCVTRGGGELPFRLELPADAPGEIGGEYTFFDERDLRRLLLVLGRRALATVEQRAVTRAQMLANAKAEAAKQADALAELERGVGR